MPEMWDLLDREGRPLGRVHPRGTPLPAGTYHLGVQIWLRDRRGRFLMSQRHPDKVCGLLWETTGGGVQAGESSLAGAMREVQEEVGIALDPQRGVCIRRSLNEAAQEFGDVWLFSVEADVPVTMQPEEVVDARWMTLEEIRAMDAAGKTVPGLPYDAFFAPEGSHALVRRARAEDASRLAEILVFSRRTSFYPIFRNDDYYYRENSVLDMALCYRDDPAARSGYHVYDDGIVRGFARWHAETETGWLDQLFVDEAFRCRGIGEALLESFRMEMHRQGIRRLRLWALEINTRARAFYERHGFRPTGERIPEEGTEEFLVCYGTDG